MLLAAGLGFCLARLKLKPGKKGKIMEASVLLFIGMIVIASRYTLEADPSDYQRTAVIDSWSGEQSLAIFGSFSFGHLSLAKLKRICDGFKVVEEEWKIFRRANDEHCKDAISFQGLIRHCG